MDKPYKTKFESDWQNAFDDAATTPSPKVWNKLDAYLDQNAQNESYRKKAILYKRMAVAASFLLLCSTCTLLWVLNENNTPLQGEDTKNIVTQNDSPINQKSESNTTLKSIDKDFTVAEDPSTALSVVQIADYSKRNTKVENAFIQNAVTNPNEGGVQKFPINEKELTGSQIALQSPYRGRLDSTLLGLNKETLAESKDTKPTKSKGFWLGADFMPLAFNPNLQINTQQVSTPVLAARGMGVIDAKDEVDNELQNNVTPVFSYQTGLQVGKRIHKRMILQTGILYAQYTSVVETRNFTYNQTNTKTPSFVALIDSTKTQNTTNSLMVEATPAEIPQSVKVYNTYAYLGVPLKVGYLLEHKKWAWVLSTGVTPQFLLRNVVSNPSDNISQVEISTGNKSAYRRVYLNAQISAEMSYQLNQNFRLALEPTYQHSLTSITKAEAAVQSIPTAFGVNVGARYIF